MFSFTLCFTPGYLWVSEEAMQFAMTLFKIMFMTLNLLEIKKITQEEQLYISSCVQNSVVITYESSSTKKK